MSYQTLLSTLQIYRAYIKQGTSHEALQEKIANTYNQHPIRTRNDFDTITISSTRNYSAAYTVKRAPTVREQFLGALQQPPALFTTQSSKDEILNELENILEALQIPQSHWDGYLKSRLTIYQIFTKLKIDRSFDTQIQAIIKMMDEKKAKSKLRLILGSLIALSFLVTLYIAPVLSGVKETVQAFLASATGLPIIGLVYTSIAAFYTMYQNHYDQNRSLFNRVRDNAFLFANTLANAAAYVIWIAFTTTMTPIVASLFVAASAVDVCKELFIAAQDYIAYRHAPIPEMNTLHGQQANARREIGFVKHRNAALINFVGAVFLLGIMAAWCFLPPTLLLTIAAVTSIVIVHAVKNTLLKRNEEHQRDALQIKLAELESQDDNPTQAQVHADPKPSPTVQPTQQHSSTAATTHAPVTDDPSSHAYSNGGAGSTLFGSKKPAYLSTHLELTSDKSLTT